MVWGWRQGGGRGARMNRDGAERVAEWKRSWEDTERVKGRR